MANFFSPKTWQNDDFSDPLECTDSKNPISIFSAEFWVQVTSRAWVSVSIGFGGPSIEPFSGVGSSIDPPSPRVESPLYIAEGGSMLFAEDTPYWTNG